MEPTALPEVLVVRHPVHADSRGLFEELHREARLAAAGLSARLVQVNHSRSGPGVLRGLHFQHPRAQAKLVSVLRGRVYEVAVDVRAGSPRYGRWAALTLTEGDGRQLWVPPGFAHGFCVVGDVAADVVYAVTAPWAPEHERVVAWDDPALAIPWPLEAPRLSARDAAAPPLSALRAAAQLP
ncbi:MAG: dTDP-4-dehydrorhamnose 3,5-epimerase [Proteobacteria bacterium]|nr:MAG: dTDP-4-dehydrorhamnose 3,5-epimerase [Pseudomonadota bacterium]